MMMTSLWLDRSTVPRANAVPFEPGDNYDDIVVSTGLSDVAAVPLLARSGRRVSVIEARPIAAVTTGNITAKLSRLQGHQL